MYDVIVVGSGPGGATIGRDLARAGAKVLVLERGGNKRVSDRGTMPGLLSMASMTDMRFLNPGATLVRALTNGGTSMLYFASAQAPPPDMLAKHGIDLSAELEEARRELPMEPLPDDLVGPKAKRIETGARDLGYAWKRLPKLIDLEKARSGSLYQAKWNARSLVQEAQSHGAVVKNGMRVTDVLTRGNRATGVFWWDAGHSCEARAEKVILAAGGIGTPLILRRSGIPEAGEGFFCDPIAAVCGRVDDIRGGDEYAMASGIHFEDEGIMLADMTLPLPLYLGFAAQALRFDRLAAHSKTLTLMVKIRDHIAGRIADHGRLQRRFDRDELARLDKGCQHAVKILKHLGARRIFRTRLTSAHPGGTARVGHLVNSDLQTRIKGLYICDCSVIPEPWGLPPTLTLYCLAKRLAAHLLASRSLGSNQKTNTDPVGIHS